VTNILAGVQFCAPHAKFPHWNPQDPYVLNDTYSDWQDVPAGTVSFSKGTKLRAKPSPSYEVFLSDGTSSKFRTKDSAMSEVARALEIGRTAKIVTVNDRINSMGTERKLQYKTPSMDGWSNFSVSSPFTLQTSYTFRIRPDHYHRVTTISGNTAADIEFFDIDALTKYVDNRIRTNGLDFKVIKVKYV
jgi:hypothetical protein